MRFFNLMVRSSEPEKDSTCGFSLSACARALAPLSPMELLALSSSKGFLPISTTTFPSSLVQELVEKCLQRNPESRPSFKEILREPVIDYFAETRFANAINTKAAIEQVSSAVDQTREVVVQVSSTVDQTREVVVLSLIHISEPTRPY